MILLLYYTLFPFPNFSIGQIFPLVLPFSSASNSKTPILLFRNASFPVDIVLKNTELRSVRLRHRAS